MPQLAPQEDAGQPRSVRFDPRAHECRRWLRRRALPLGVVERGKHVRIKRGGALGGTRKDMHRINGVPCVARGAHCRDRRCRCPPDVVDRVERGSDMLCGRW